MLSSSANPSGVLTTMRRATQRTARASAAASNPFAALRNAIAGLTLGACIGSVGTLLVVEEREKREPAVVPEIQISKPGDVLRHEAIRYGLPSQSNVHVRSGYVVSYDYRTRNAAWVMEYLTPHSLQATDDTDRAKSSFHVDTTVPTPFRVHPNVFAKSGYDKGHLVPARDMAGSQTAMNESFLMTNISPQVGVGFNRSYWSRLEGFVRHLAYQYDGLYVVTGPLFLPKKSKKSGDMHVSYPVLGTPPDTIAVPTHFFKVLLAKRRDGSFLTAGFILPNQAIPEKKQLVDFLTPLDVIEKYSGLLFFDKLEGVRTLELCKETTCSLASANYQRAMKHK